MTSRDTQWIEPLERRLLLAYTLTFEGLGNLEPIAEYYNGGYGGQGSGPGPNYGVSFSGNALSIIDSDDGGTGNFGGEPSSPNIAFFLTGGGALTMNVPAGFERGFSFYYTAINNPGFIRVYDGLNASGKVLATITLPLTPYNGAPDPTGAFSPLVARTVEFTGTAKSVDFGGTANQIGFDNITLGPLIEVQDFQRQKADAVKVATLISEPGVLDSSGNPTAKFNKLDNDRFFIVIDDKSLGTPQTVINQIEVVSLGRDGTTVLDRLAKLRLNRQTDRRFASQPLILVADAQDDAFGGNEGTENDLTLQAEAGGKLKIKYTDAAGVINEKEINVGRPADVKKIQLNIKYINGIGYAEAGIRAMVTDASKLFSQANTYLEIKSITGINDPGGLADLDEFTGPTPTAEERQLLSIDNDTAANVIDMYFVRSLSNGSLGEAFTPSYFTNPGDVALLGSIVISSAGPFKTVAHEVIHVAINNGNHPTDTRLVLSQGLVTGSSLLKKRIPRAQGAAISGGPFASSAFTASTSTGSGSSAGIYSPAVGSPAVRPVFAVAGVRESSVVSRLLPDDRALW